MTPERKEQIGPHKVEEFYWNGRMIVYVDNQLSGSTFEAAVDGIKGMLEHEEEKRRP